MIETKEIKELSQIKLGPLTISGPMMLRVHLNMLPDFTIDLTKKPELGILSIIKPRATVLIGSNAYKLDPWADNTISSADPSIFYSPTWFDSFAQVGIIPTIIFLGALTYGIYKLVQWRRGK